MPFFQYKFLLLRIMSLIVILPLHFSIIHEGSENNKDGKFSFKLNVLASVIFYTGDDVYMR